MEAQPVRFFETEAMAGAASGARAAAGAAGRVPLQAGCRCNTQQAEGSGAVHAVRCVPQCSSADKQVRRTSAAPPPPAGLVAALGEVASFLGADFAVRSRCTAIACLGGSVLCCA